MNCSLSSKRIFPGPGVLCIWILSVFTKSGVTPFRTSSTSSSQIPSFGAKFIKRSQGNSEWAWKKLCYCISPRFAFMPPYCRYIFCFPGNGAVWRYRRAILTYVVKKETLHWFEPPARATPRFCGDTRTKARKCPFKLIQRFLVPIHYELIAHGSEDMIHIKEYNSLTGILHKSSVLGYQMAYRGAWQSALSLPQPYSEIMVTIPCK
jgi:hypothetical protein